MFCDFCTCSDCQNGTERLHHAQTADGSWICEICYLYDECTTGPLRSSTGPCDNKDCIHRPTIVSEWTIYKN